MCARFGVPKNSLSGVCLSNLFFFIQFRTLSPPRIACKPFDINDFRTLCRATEGGGPFLWILHRLSFALFSSEPRLALRLCVIPCSVRHGALSFPAKCESVRGVGWPSGRVRSRGRRWDGGRREEARRGEVLGAQQKWHEA